MVKNRRTANRNVNGLTSLGLLAAIIATGIIAIGKVSVQSAALYAVITTVCIVYIVISFCSRCPSRLTGCGPLLFGQLTRIVGRRPSGGYRRKDFLLRNMSLFIIIAIPQFWLIQHPSMFLVFWLLVGVRGIHLIKRICITCENRFCQAEMGLDTYCSMQRTHLP